MNLNGHGGTTFGVWEDKSDFKNCVPQNMKTADNQRMMFLSSWMHILENWTHVPTYQYVSIATIICHFFGTEDLFNNFAKSRFMSYGKDE
jgi:hypothetical protein